MKSGSHATPRNAVPVLTPWSASDGPHTWVVAFVLGALIAVVYGPSLKAPFIFDDFGAIMDNESISRLWPLIGTTKPGPLNPPPEFPTSGRPLVNLSFAINHYFGGLNPTGYHTVNLLLHFLAVMFVWAATRRTLRLPFFGGEFSRSAGWLALAIALLWALHPLQTEAVIYVTQRTELMMAFFYLATIYCALRHLTQPSRELDTRRGGRERQEVNRPRPAGRWAILASVSCAAGMASKEVMVSAPLMVLLFDRVFVAGSLAAALRRSWPLYLGLFATWSLLLVFNIGAPHRDAAGFSLGVSAYDWWLTQSKVFWMYMRLAVWPWPLLIHYHFPYYTSLATAWPYVLPLLLLGIVALVLLWRNTSLGFLLTWLFAILSPTFMIPIVTEMAAERRMYLALLPLVTIAVVGAWRLANVALRQYQTESRGEAECRSSLRAAGLPILILTIVYCAVSTHRLAAYDNELNLWLEVRRFQPSDYMAPQSIGLYLEKQGHDPAAEEQFRQAIQLHPDASLAQYKLGLLLSKRGEYEQAAVHFAEAARIIPTSSNLRSNLAYTLLLAGRNQEAITAFREAIKLDPGNWAAHKNLGIAQQRAGDFQASIDSLEAALNVNPRAIEIYSDLAKSYNRLGQQSTAIAMLERGLDSALAAGDTDNAKRFTSALEALKTASDRRE